MTKKCKTNQETLKEIRQVVYSFYKKVFLRGREGIYVVVLFNDQFVFALAMVVEYSRLSNIPSLCLFITLIYVGEG